ncbi:AEC family transporter [Tepidibacter sp. Z1-5]|uniref:AEC family transporter n=1 Tax=Tepidibacter sp. Z1-5 TaxID=3134138 RepID=UPI0030C42EB9
MNFMSTFNQVFMLFALILIGYTANKKKLITQNLNKELSNVILYITLPCLIIKSMQYEFSIQMLKSSIGIIIISIAMYLVSILISFFVIKNMDVKGKVKDILQYLIIFPNVGFMGYPVISAIYGDSGVFYTALFNMPFNILVWSFGVMIMSRHYEESSGMNLKKIIFNPGMLAIITGYTLFLLSIKIPTPIYNILNVLANTTTPMSMILVGSILAQSSINDAIKNKYLLIVSCLRLLIIPCIVYFTLSNVFHLKGVLLGIPSIVSGMPSAANCAIFATKYDNDHILASQGIFITTLLSVITIPLIVFLMNSKI